MPKTVQPTSGRSAALPDFVLRQFDRGSTEYNHRQLYLILQTGIRDAVLAAGNRLPSTRLLAKALGIARNTVVHVYEQLALEGQVQAGVGAGHLCRGPGPSVRPPVACQSRWRSAAPPCRTAAPN